MSVFEMGIAFDVTSALKSNVLEGKCCCCLRHNRALTSLHVPARAEPSAINVNASRDGQAAVE